MYAGKSAFTSSRRTSMNDILRRVQKVEEKEAEVRGGSVAALGQPRCGRTLLAWG